MTTPNRSDITIGSRWLLTRRGHGTTNDYVGFVFEINWREREARVYAEDGSLGRGQWLSFDVLTVQAPIELELDLAALPPHISRIKLEEAVDLAIRGFERWKRNQKRGGNRHEAEHRFTDLGQAIADLRELRRQPPTPPAHEEEEEPS